MIDESDPNLMPWELYEDTVLRNPYVLQEPSEKQAVFLRTERQNVLFGGSASGGKSSALLMAALQFCHLPVFKGYAALIVRRSLQDLKQPGGLIDRALEWLEPHIRKRNKKGTVEWNGADYRLRFPNGTTIQFGYCDNEGDERRYHGSEYQLIALDEGAQFSERQIVFFMAERLRKRIDIAVPLRFRIGTTPGGPGHEFIKKKFIDPGDEDCEFIPARVDDNPGVDADGYVLSLRELEKHDPLRYRQMLLGDWNAVEGGRFKAEWFGWWNTDKHVRDTMVLTTHTGIEVERFQPAHCGRFMTVDPAASTSSKADYTVASVWMVTPRANIVWWGCKRGRFEIHEQVGICQSEYRRYEPQFLAVEEVLNQRALAQQLRRSVNPVMVVKSVSPMGRDKLARAAGAISLAASGRVFLPQTDPLFPLSDVVAELVSFTGEDKKGSHDDCVDCMSYMTELLPFVRAGHNGSCSRAPFRHAPRVLT